MVMVLDLANNPTEVSLDTLKFDVKCGLERTLKQINAKYLYDEHGSELFNQITRHPDYYLTRTEIEILDTNKQYLSNLVGTVPFNLVELGPGEGIKTEILINQFLHDKRQFSYMPIDISAKYLRVILNNFTSKLPDLEAKAIHADYFVGLEWIRQHSARRNVVLFLGSSIGNFDLQEVKEFLTHLHASLNQDDLVLFGFDLCKDINILLRAYNDSDGITSEFNFNLLRRLNRELGANFDVQKFSHYPTYNVHTNAMESYLISNEEQTVAINALGRSFQFRAIEPIHIEFSHKYSLRQIQSLAQQAGFKIRENLLDKRQYFVNSLWQVD